MNGPANDKNTPVELPNNEWTQMIEAVRARNQRGMSLTADDIAGVPITGTPLPSVRSADLGRPVEDATRPLTTDEIEELNREAIRSGMVTGPVTPGIGNALSDDAPYGSLEEAIAAGAPVGADETAVAEGAAAFRETPAPPIIRVRSPRMIAPSARHVSPGAEAASAPQLPRLPDFKKVQMIDLVNAKVYVDGLEFSLEASELKMLRKFCVTKAKEQIQRALDAALKELTDVGEGDS